ncbi:MAG: hypothetical protein AB7Q29_19605 [Vicinamibacterales bacterium]
MSGVTGRSMRLAFAKFATGSWGAAASVTKGLYIEGDAGMQYRPAQVTDDAFGQPFLGQADPGLVEAPTLSLVGRDRYEDHQYILEALAMGSPAAVAIATSASGQTTSWTHQFDLADSIDGLGITAAIDKVLYVEELTSIKVHGFEVTQAQNGAMNQTFRVTGSKPTNISSVNVAATVAGAAYPSLGNRIMQQQGVFRMNVHGAGSLTSSDALKVESVKLTFNRPQDAPHVYGQDYVDEPADNGWPELMLEVTYPRMNTLSANSLYAGLRSSTAFKADWTFSGAHINSTDRYQKLYQFPFMQLMDDGFVAATAGPNQVKPVAKFALRQAATSPSGMPFIRPLRVTRIMTNSVVAF